MAEERAESSGRPGGGVERAVHPLCAGAAWMALHPFRWPSLRTPRSVGVAHRSLRIASRDAELAAWFVPRDGARAGLVLCHGYNDSRKQLLPLVRPLHEAGFHLLLFDFRSMGLSTGSLCTYGLHEQQDVLAAAEWLRRETTAESVGLYGLSMGGAAAILAAAAEPAIAAVATDCAFARLEDMIEQRFLFLPPGLRAPVSRSVGRWCVRWAGEEIRRVDPEEAVRAWQPRPLFVIHAGGDRLTPPAHGRRLAAAAGPAADLWIVPDAPHVGCRRAARQEYFRRLTAFFHRHLPAAGSRPARYVAKPQTGML